MLPDFVTNAEIYENVVEMCGLYDFVFEDGGRNGEGICELYVLGIHLPCVEDTLYDSDIWVT